MMPEMDGMELCTYIKENPSLCHLPVILLTAKSMTMYVEEGFQAGADDYLVKPFKVSTLIVRINNILVVPAAKYMPPAPAHGEVPENGKALRPNKPVVISTCRDIEKSIPDEAAFFREYGVTTLLAAPFSTNGLIKDVCNYLTVTRMTRFSDTIASMVVDNQPKSTASVGSNKNLQIQSGRHPYQFLWRHGDHQLQRDIDRRRY